MQVKFQRNALDAWRINPRIVSRRVECSISMKMPMRLVFIPFWFYTPRFFTPPSSCSGGSASSRRCASLGVGGGLFTRSVRTSSTARTNNEPLVLFLQT